MMSARSTRWSIAIAVAFASFAGSLASGLSVEAGPDDGWSPASLEVFETFGLEISPAAFRGAFGRIHGLQYDAETGVWTGAADPDWEGAAVTPRPPGGGRGSR